MVKAKIKRKNSSIHFGLKYAETKFAKSLAWRGWWISSIVAYSGFECRFFEVGFTMFDHRKFAK